MTGEEFREFIASLAPDAAPKVEKLDLDGNELGGAEGWREFGGALSRGALRGLKCVP